MEMPTESAGGYVLVVKATLTGEGLFITSLRRLSREEFRRDLEIKRLLRSRQRKKQALQMERGGTWAASRVLRGGLP